VALGELFEEAHIAGVEVADVGDAVEHHRDALDTHAEGKAGDLFGVVGVVGWVYFSALCGDGGEDGGVNHAAAEELDPAGVLALAAAGAAAEDAADLDVGTGFGEGEERWEEAGLTSEPKRAFMAWSKVPFRSEKVMLVSTQRPSI